MNEDINWDDVSFILSSKYRKKLLELLDKPKTPTQLKGEIELHFNQISRNLIELEREGFIDCLNPTQKRTRFYRINEKGRKLLRELESSFKRDN